MRWKQLKSGYPVNFSDMYLYNIIHPLKQVIYVTIRNMLFKNRYCILYIVKELVFIREQKDFFYHLVKESVGNWRTHKKISQIGTLRGRTLCHTFVSMSLERAKNYYVILKTGMPLYGCLQDTLS